MSIKTTHKFYACQSFIVVFCTIVITNGCATVDKIISDPTSTPSSPPTSTPSPPDNVTPSPTPTDTSQSSNPNAENGGSLESLPIPRECSSPNQAEYVYGNYKLGWTIGGSRYEGLLHMEGQIGKMRVQYFDEYINRTQTVDQTMKLASCTWGLVMLGFNPVFADTNQEHPTYAADNLIFRRETNGDVTIMNYDDQGLAVLVEIEPLSD